MRRRIVTTTSVFPPGYPAEAAADRLAALGFEALDMALDYWTQDPSWPFMGERYLDWAQAVREHADAAGIPYTHAHAPGDADSPLTRRSLETAAALGAGYIVVHPIWRDADGAVIDDEEAFIRRNAEAVEPWLDTAARCGVVILSENLLWGASRDPAVIAALVREVGSPQFGWCWDTGHSNCFGYTPEALLRCAAPPLSLHLQDNRGGFGDEHLIPGEGTVDFAGVLRVLRAAGYAGDCVLEAHHQSLDAPDEARDAVLTRLLAAARPLRDAMEAWG